MQRCINARRRKLWGMHLFCIKYELLYSHAKSRDRFIAAILSSLARSLRLGEGHMVSLRVTWSRFGQKTNQLNASWGSESPFSITILNIHKSRESWRKKLINKTKPVASRPPTHFCPSSACFPHSLKDLIHLCAGTAPHKQLCTSKSLHLSPSFYLTSSACVPFLAYVLDGLPKEKNKNISFALPVWPGCRFWTIQDSKNGDGIY